MRIVYKIGSSSLTNEDGSLREEKLSDVASQLGKLHGCGHELILVTSGSIAAGTKGLGFEKRPKKIADKQACAAVGQGLLMQQYTNLLKSEDIVTSQILLTQSDFQDKTRYQNVVQVLEVLLNKGVIPIINENDTVATEEIKVGDNDNLSAQVAASIKAVLLVFLTDVDGLYTDNPAKNNNAKHIGFVDEINADMFDMACDSSSKNGTGGMITKLQAAQLATHSGVNVFMCSSFESDSLINAVSQKNKGTFFKADPNGLNNYKQWLSFYAKPRARVCIDDGAKNAVLENGKSLLNVGVIAYVGSFEEGDIVNVYDIQNEILIGRGKVRTSSNNLALMISKQKKDGILIHRDDFVVL